MPTVAGAEGEAARVAGRPGPLSPPSRDRDGIRDDVALLVLWAARQPMGCEIAIEGERLFETQSTDDRERKAVGQVNRVVIVPDEQVVGHLVIFCHVRLDPHHRACLQSPQLLDRLRFADSFRHPIDVFDQHGPSQDEPRAGLEGGAEIRHRPRVILVSGCGQRDQGAGVDVGERLRPPVLPVAPRSPFELEAADDLEDRVPFEPALFDVHIGLQRLPEHGLQRQGPTVREMLETRVRDGIDLGLDDLL